MYAEGDNKVSDHDHVTGKHRGTAHKNCNINLRLTKKFLIIFHNLKGYDSHLIMKEIVKCAIKIDVIANGLEKYMVFIDSMQFMNSILDVFVKILSDNDFRCLSQECSGTLLG